MTEHLIGLSKFRAAKLKDLQPGSLCVFARASKSFVGLVAQQPVESVLTNFLVELAELEMTGPKPVKAALHPFPGWAETLCLDISSETQIYSGFGYAVRSAWAKGFPRGALFLDNDRYWLACVSDDGRYSEMEEFVDLRSGRVSPKPGDGQMAGSGPGYLFPSWGLVWKPPGLQGQHWLKFDLSKLLAPTSY